MARLTLAMLLLLVATGSAPGQGRLAQLRHDMSHSSSWDVSLPQHQDASGTSTYSGEEVGAAVLLAGLVLGAPFYVPAMLLDENSDTRAEFPSYPYADDYPGFLWLGHDPQGVAYRSADSDASLKNWSLRLTGEDGNDFRGINRLGGRLVLDTSSCFGADAEWSWFQEALAGRTDTMSLGNANLTYRFAQKEWLQFLVGLGGRWATDSQQTHGGFNCAYGCDWTPSPPWVVSTRFDAGNLGDALVVHGRLSFGAVYRHGEILGGYDFQRIGSVNLQGPFLGLRLWF